MPVPPSGSSSSSFSSSSLGYPPSYAHTYASPHDSTWTPSSSAVSAVTSSTSSAPPPPTPLRPLDLGPPGYQATITLFDRTPNETTVYLGPWEIVASDTRRVRWQCSYQGEVLEHFLPSNNPADIFPHTLHARHRPYGDPCDMELYLTFREPHRIRYITRDGTIVHDDHIEVKYEFTTLDGSHRFQGDLRSQDLIDHFDFDVIWSDRDGRTDSFGSVRGIGAIQRLKLWRDRYTTYHYLTFFANRTDRRYREYLVYSFEGEIRNRDDGHRRLRLNARGRRGSAPDNSSTNSATSGRRFSMSSLRQRQRSIGHGSSQGSGSGSGSASASASGTASRSSHSSHSHSEQASTSSSSASAGSGLDIRYLAIQFSRNEDYRRFIERWAIAHAADSEFRGVPFPSDRFELPSPEILPGERAELAGSGSLGGLQTVQEPSDRMESDETP